MSDAKTKKTTYTQHVEGVMKSFNTKSMVTSGFVKADNKVLRAMAQEVDPTSCLVYIVLLSHRNDTTDECFPTKELLSREVNCSIRTIERSLLALKEADYIHVVRPHIKLALRFFFPQESFYNAASEKAAKLKYGDNGKNVKRSARDRKEEDKDANNKVIDIEKVKTAKPKKAKEEESNLKAEGATLDDKGVATLDEKSVASLDDKSTSLDDFLDKGEY